MLTTPAIYGAGDAGDVATIRTANLIWKRRHAAPRRGDRRRRRHRQRHAWIFKRERIEFGYGPICRSPAASISFDRLALGFANVNLNASERITANHKGSLSVYQTQGAYDPVKGYAIQRRQPDIRTPLLTGEAGSVNAQGGRRADASGAGRAAPPAWHDSGLGAELALQAATACVATARGVAQRQADGSAPSTI